MPLGREVDLGAGDIVRWGRSPSLQMGTAPNFWAHISCGQTAGWMKMALGMEVSLNPGDIVLDGDPARP